MCRLAWAMLPLLLVLVLSGPAAGQGENEVYNFVPLAETITQPWRRAFRESPQTDPAASNAGAFALNMFLQNAMKDQLEKTACKVSWREFGKFLDWAVWGYISPYSKFRGDPRLIEMSRTWLEGFPDRLQTRPTDPEKAKDWAPDRISGYFWSFHDLTTPLLMLDEEPALKDAIGAELVDRYRRIVIENIALLTRPEHFNKLIAQADHYVNMATHPMPVYVHGWLLTGEEKYLKMAQSIVAILHRDQTANGMFPYRYRMYGDRHMEFEGMYDRAMDLRALYVYWWATGSKIAEECFRRSIPWYPLNLEPPYHYNDGPNIWWKDQWRTFWPLHVAMTAGVTGDGENAAIARLMAEHRVSVDRFDLVLGSHAYDLMAKVESKPVRDQYLVEDGDIRGLRLRRAPWSATFTAGSFTYTRASAMLVSQDQRKYDALHMARPNVRVEPVEKIIKAERDYNVLGPQGADYHAVRDGMIAAAGTVYAPILTPASWTKMPTAPWRMAELWLMTPTGLVGLIDSLAEAEQKVYEITHQYRFIVAADQWSEVEGGSTWNAGGLKVQVLATDFKHHVVERARRYCQGNNDRKDFQISLLDRSRLPEEEAQQTRSKAENEALVRAGRLPAQFTVPAGYRRYSLVSIAPADSIAPVQAVRIQNPRLVGFDVVMEGRTCHVRMNPTDTEADGLKPGQVSLSFGTQP